MVQQIKTGTLLSGYSYEIAFPNPRIWQDYYIMTISLPYNIPHIFIDCLLNDLMPEKLLHNFSASQKLTLEGAFSDFYVTYVSDIRRIEFLTLMTPNVMYEVMKPGLMCDVEFVDKRLVLYWPARQNDNELMQTMITSGDLLTQKLDRILRRFSDLQEVVPVDATTSSAREAGMRLDNATLEIARPRTLVQTLDLVALLATVLPLGVLVFLFIIVSSVDDSAQAMGLIMPLYDFWIRGVVVVMLIVICYRLFVRKTFVKRYKEQLRHDFEVARKNLVG